MAIKKKITKQEFDALPDYIQDSYKASGDDFVLTTVEGFADSARLNEFRDNNRTLQEQINTLTEKAGKFSDEDITELERLRAVQLENEEKDLIERGEIDTIMATRMKPITEAHVKALQSRDEKITTMTGQLGNLLIRDKGQALAVKAGINGDEQMGDFLGRLTKDFQVVDGKAVRINEGEIVYGDDGAALTLDDTYVESVKSRAPYLFRQPEGSGADPSGGSRRGGGGNTEGMTSAQKIAGGLDDLMTTGHT